MGLSLIFESATAAASVGLGCGTCCGTGISAALYAYLMAHVRDLKQSIGAFGEFLLGKLLAVTMVCTLASLLGTGVLTEAGLVLGIPVQAFTDLGMVLVGAWLLIGWFRESGRSCRHCSQLPRRQEPEPNEKLSHLALLGMGFGYGISPCAPLLLMSAYAATLPVGAAAVLACIFSLASALSPGLFFLLLSGSLAGRMRKEIPKALTWLRLVSYVLLLLVFGSLLCKEVFL